MEESRANDDIKCLPIYSLAHELPIRVTRLTNKHPVYLIENFLTADECDFIIKFGEPKLQPSTAIENDKLVIATYRTSWTAFITEGGKPSSETVLKNIQQRASAFSWYPIQHLEAFNLTRYRYGEKYVEHVDYFDKNHTQTAGKAGQRVCTFFVYLNDVPEDAGGCTEFTKLGIKVHPKKGNSVFWLNTSFDGTPFDVTSHLGEVIKSDGVTKYGMNIWVRQNAF